MTDCAISTFRKKIPYNFLFALLFAVLVVAPDYIIGLHSVYAVTFQMAAVGTILGIGLLLSFVRSKVWCLIFLSLFAVIQSIQLGHILFFQRAMNPADVGKIGSEMDEIGLVVQSQWGDYWYAFPLMFLPFILAYIFYAKLSKRMFQFPWAFLLLAFILVFGVCRVVKKPHAQLHLPTPLAYSMFNSTKTFCYYLGAGMWQKEVVPAGYYKPYVVEFLPSVKEDNIILVVGESANPQHMNLFGYARENTPKLNALKSNPSFDCQIAVASGVATHTALTFLLNGVNEPGNLLQLKRETTNIFNLAQKRGYYTSLLSSQNVKSTYELGVGYIDNIHTKTSDPDTFNDERRDMALVDALATVPTDKRNLVVMQMRTPHIPYSENYTPHSSCDKFPRSENRHDDSVNCYDNSIMVMDEVLGALVKALDQKFKNYTLIFVSDHSEHLGEYNIWGHNYLSFSGAYVPYFSLSTRGYKIGVDMPTHYEIARFVSDLMGVSISNPNFHSKFYIHGDNFYNDYEFIEFEKKGSAITSSRQLFLKAFIDHNQADSTPSAKPAH